MNFKKLLLITLTGAALSSFAADPVSNQQFNEALGKIRNEAKAGRGYDAVKLDQGLRGYLKQDSLSSSQKNRLISEILINAFSATPELWGKALELYKSLPDGQEKTDLSGNAMAELARKLSSETALARLAEYQAAVTGAVDQRKLFDVYARLAAASLNINGDQAAYKKNLDLIVNAQVPVDAKGNPNKQILNAQKAKFRDCVLSYITYDPVEAEEFFKANKTVIDEELRNSILREKLVYSKKNKHRKVFDDTLAEIQAMSDDNPAKKDLIIRAADTIGNHALIEKMLENKDLDAATQVDLLLILWRVSSPSVYIYSTFYTPGSYEKQKEYAQKIDQIVEAQLAKSKQDPKVRPLTGSSISQFYAKEADLAFGFGDYAFGDQMLEKALARDPASLPVKAEQLMRKGEFAEAAKLYESLPTVKGFRNNRVLAYVPYIVYFLKGGSCDGFDKAFSEKKLTPEQKLTALRQCSLLYFRTKHFDKAKEIYNWINANMIRPPEVNKIYHVKYVENIPQTAGAWAYTPAFNDWKSMETRFTPYYYYHSEPGMDTKYLLKDLPEVTLKEEYRTGLQILCDNSGVHIFLRADDPNVNEIVEGKRSFGTLEWVFQPGKDHPYHTLFTENLPKAGDSINVNWATPTVNYSLTEDIFTQDAALTKNGVAAHLYIPWLMVWNKLPSQDNIWRLGLQVWGPESRTLSGAVHELERTLKLHFDFTPAQKLALQRQIARMAYNRYANMRKSPAGKIQTWNDPVLGDPEFYKSELEALVAELDEAGAKLDKASDAEIPAIFEKYVPLWAGIDYKLDELRTAYIKKQLLSDK